MINIVDSKTTFWTNNVQLERRLKIIPNVKWHVSSLEFHFGRNFSRRIAHAIKRGLEFVSKMYANQEVKRLKSARELKHKFKSSFQWKVIFVGFQSLSIYLFLFQKCILLLMFVLSNQRFAFYRFLECGVINKPNKFLHSARIKKILHGIKFC